MTIKKKRSVRESTLSLVRKSAWVIIDVSYYVTGAVFVDGWVGTCAVLNAKI